MKFQDFFQFLIFFVEIKKIAKAKKVNAKIVKAKIVKAKIVIIKNY